MKRTGHKYHQTGVTIGLMVISLMACGPAEQKNGETAVFDSAKTKTPRITDHFQSNQRGIEDSVIYEFIRKYPEMEFAFVPTEDGKLTTVKGNFQVEVDGMVKKDELNKFVRYLEENFEKRAIMRDKFNKGIDVAAKPQGGYEAYYDALEKNLKHPESNGEVIGAAVFVEFIVNEAGEITRVKAIDNTYYGPHAEVVSAMKAAAVEAVRATQWEWIPARCDGQPVKMKMEIPVQFTGR